MDPVNASSDLLYRREKLSSFLFENRMELKNVHALKLTPYSVTIGLASSISLTTRAPLEWNLTRPLNEFNAHPPAPQFDQMRAGKLEKINAQEVLKNRKMKRQGTQSDSDRCKSPREFIKDLSYYEALEICDADESNRSPQSMMNVVDEETRQNKFARSERPFEYKQEEEPVVEGGRRTFMSFGEDDDDSDDDPPL